MKKDYTYDSLDRVKEMTYTDLETGKVMESYCYNYDKNSNITEKTEVNNYPKEEKDKVNETKAYTYDALGRLPLRYNNDKQKKPLFSRGLSVCRLLFNSFSKLKIDENYKEKRRLFY